ncbi:MAG: zinc-dependent metalloprotease, partial [Mameliella sp.]|nr:zinc-dependent metalloprotease [Phaeodactylibacter sp.]
TPNFVNGRRVERVDGDLCNISGDGFCDTPPDYLSYRWSCSAQGVSNVLQSDPVDSTFRSDGSYFMSYASDACMNQFSLGQVDAMRANINNQRPGLLNNSFEPDFIGEDFQVVPVAPDSGATFDNTSAITLEWEAVPNAIGYAVDLDLFVPFNGATISFRSYTTTTNSITMTNLQSNRTYIWKVRPFSRVDGCTSYGPEQSFSVGQFVDSKDLDAQETGLTVFPQPASTGSERLNINAVLPKAELATVRLINGHGQQVRLLNYDVQAGSNQMFIDIKNLTPGFYMLEIVTNSGRWATKTILTR